MNKTKFLAFFAVSAIFLACGSQDEVAPKEEIVVLLDSEPNDTEELANNIASDGTKFAGTLDGSEEDFYTFMLRIGMGDIVEITINASEALRVDFYRPGVTKKTWSVKSGVLQEIIGTSYLIEGDIVGGEIPFYIRLYPIGYDSPPNAYKISVVIKK